MSTDLTLDLDREQYITDCGWCRTNPVIVAHPDSTGICASCLAKHFPAEEPPDPMAFWRGVRNTLLIVAAFVVLGAAVRVGLMVAGVTQ
jgi:hypothetical protein